MNLRERLAELEHIRWALWTEHMLDNMDEVHVANWRRQIATPYADLSEKEKDSDREWADRVIAILEEGKMNLRERLAALAYGIVYLDPETAYNELPETYKDEYRYWADRILAILDEVEDEVSLETAQELVD